MSTVTLDIKRYEELREKERAMDSIVKDATPIYIDHNNNFKLVGKDDVVKALKDEITWLNDRVSHLKDLLNPPKNKKHSFIQRLHYLFTNEICEI